MPERARRLKRGLYSSMLAAHTDLNGFAPPGKPAKPALTAVMRKLVLLANTLIRKDRYWTPQHA